MELRFQAGGPEQWSAGAVIVFLSEGEKLEKAYPELLEAAPAAAPGFPRATPRRKPSSPSSTAASPVSSRP